MKQRADTQPRAGYSLIELLIVLTVLALILGSVAMVGNANQNAYETGITSAHLESQAEIAMGRILAELRAAGVETLVPDPTAGLGSDQLQYAQAVDVVDGEVVWAPRRSLEFVHELGELDDGLDNNGNGLADEGRVVLTEDVDGLGERQMILTRWVSEGFAGEFQNGLDDNANGLIDEPGFCVEWSGAPEGETLLVRLSLQRLDQGGRLLARAVETSIRIRN